MPRVAIAVLASGQGSNLQALLEWAATDDAAGRVVLVAGNRAGAGALARSRAAGIQAEVIAEDDDGAALLQLLQHHRIQLVVLAGYLKKVPDAVVAAFRGRVLNIHPALLPAFGGAGMYGRHVHEAVIAAGARVSGATVHVVDEHYDRGPIVAQWPVPVRLGDTAETLAARVLGVEHQLLPAVVSAFCRRLETAQPLPAALRPAADAFVLSNVPEKDLDAALVAD